MTDWAALLVPAARSLLADRPCRERNGELRFGTKGSLVVHVRGPRAGTFHDFEADVSGGTLRLVEHLTGCDRAGALRWLEEQRLIKPRNGAQTPARPASVPTKRAPAPRPSPTADVAHSVLDAALPADKTPARVYLARRWTWPPDAIGPDLPATVRWCDARNVPARLPSTAAGVLVFVLRRPGVADVEEPAVSLEALTSSGERLPERWRRTFGSKAGCVFTAADRPGGSVVLVEGERDALAVALTTAAGSVRSVGGTAGFRPEVAADPAARPVVLVPDADHAGSRAVVPLVAALAARSVRLAPWPQPPAGDPADWLRDWLIERAGRFEFDGSMNRLNATAASWRALLADVAAGVDILGLDAEADIRPAIENGAGAKPHPARPSTVTP